MSDLKDMIIEEFHEREVALIERNEKLQAEVERLEAENRDLSIELEGKTICYRGLPQETKAMIEALEIYWKVHADNLFGCEGEECPVCNGESNHDNCFENAWDEFDLHRMKVKDMLNMKESK